jgi:hypothetical protein
MSGLGSFGGAIRPSFWLIVSQLAISDIEILALPRLDPGADIILHALKGHHEGKRTLSAWPKFIQEAVFVLEKHLLAIRHKPLDRLPGFTCSDPGVVLAESLHSVLEAREFYPGLPKPLHDLGNNEIAVRVKTNFPASALAVEWFKVPGSTEIIDHVNADAGDLPDLVGGKGV